MVTTLIPRMCKSRARGNVMAAMAPLLAAYAACPAMQLGLSEHFSLL